MKHVPSRLVADVQLASQLQCADSLAGRHEQVRSVNPCPLISDAVVLQRSARVGIEVGSAISTPVALLSLLLLGDSVSRPALDAMEIVAPSNLLHVLNDGFLCGKHALQIEEAQSAGFSPARHSC